MSADHAFQPHLWKKGACRECTLREEEHPLVGLVGRNGNGASSSAAPPTNFTHTQAEAIKANGPPPPPPSASLPPPIPEGFRKPQLPVSLNGSGGPMSRVGSMPPPMPPKEIEPNETVVAKALEGLLRPTLAAPDSPNSIRSPPVAPSRAPPPPPPIGSSNVVAGTGVAVATAASQPIAPTNGPPPSPHRFQPPPIPSNSSVAAAPSSAAKSTPPPPPPRSTPPPPRYPPPMPPSQAATANSPSNGVTVTPPPLPVATAATASATPVAVTPPPVPTSALRTANGPPPRPNNAPTPTTHTTAPAVETVTPTVAIMSAVHAASSDPCSSGSLSPRPVSHRLVDYFAVFGRGSPRPFDPSLVDLLGWCGLTFVSSTLSRIPFEDHSDSTFSGNTDTFCFPSQVQIQQVPLKQVSDPYAESFTKRRPTLHRFVLTKIDGSKQYCSTLIMWERMDRAEMDHLLMELETESCKVLTVDKCKEAIRKLRNVIDPVSPSSTSDDVHVLFQPKALTIVSSWPFYTLFEEFLRAIVRISHVGITSKSLTKMLNQAAEEEASSSDGTSDGPNALVTVRTPLERYIMNLLFEIPVPPPGLIQVKYILPGCSLENGPSVLISRPAINQLPMCDIQWHLIFRAIDHPTFVGIFVAVATEQKVLLVSKHRNLISAVCDAISVLLFPFTWAGVYMPLLPDCMFEFLHAPVPFVAGISTTSYTSRREDIPDDLVIVELDLPRIHLPTIDTLPKLPETVYKKLLNHLKQHADIQNRQHPLIGLSDHAFPFGQDMYKMDVIEPDVDEDDAEEGEEDDVVGRFIAGAIQSNSMTNAPPGGSMAPIVESTASDAAAADDDDDAPPLPPYVVPAAYQGRSTLFEPPQTYLRHSSMVETIHVNVNKPMPIPTTSPAAAAASAASLTSSPLSGDEKSLHIEDVRFGFLRLWCKLMAKYERFMPWGTMAASGASPPDSPREGGGGGNGGGDGDRDWFNTNGFLSDAPRDARPFLTLFTRTQMFAKFIDDRIQMHGDVERFASNRVKLSSASPSSANGGGRSKARHGVMSDNEDSDSDGEGGHAIEEGEEEENEEEQDTVSSIESTTRMAPSYSISPSGHHRKNRASMSYSASSRASLAFGGGGGDGHSRHGSSNDPSTYVCQTVPPPSALSNQIDSADPTSMPVLHAIQYFNECILAKKNRRRQKLIGGIASGRLFGGKGFHETPFLNDTTTSFESIKHVRSPDRRTGLQMDQRFVYPVVKTTIGLEGEKNFFPVFPALAQSLYGQPRTIQDLIPNTQTPIVPTPTPLVYMTEPMNLDVIKEDPTPMQATPTTPTTPTPTTPSGRALPPPGRAGAASVSIGANIGIGVGRASVVVGKAMPPPGRAGVTGPPPPPPPPVTQITGPPPPPVATRTLPELVVSTPATSKIVPGARGSFSSFHSRNHGGVSGMKDKINQMATLLSFENFGGVRRGDSISIQQPSSSSSSTSSSTTSSSSSPSTSSSSHGSYGHLRPNESIGTLKLAKLMGCDVQDILQQRRLNRGSRKDMKQIDLTKSSVIWTPPVYDENHNNNNKNGTTSTSSSSSTTNGHSTHSKSNKSETPNRRSSIFSFMSTSSKDKSKDKASPVVGVSISSPILVSPASSAPAIVSVMPPPIPVAFAKPNTPTTPTGFPPPPPPVKAAFPPPPPPHTRSGSAESQQTNPPTPAKRPPPRPTMA